MIKFVNTLVSLTEVPDLISLSINISNCPNNCPNCHSPELAQDIGAELDIASLELLIKGNKGINCICFLGGDSSHKEINTLAKYIKKFYPSLKVAWYSGKEYLSPEIDLINFDFIKLGPYIEEKGPLNNPNTNQVFWKVIHFNDGTCTFSDYTFKFQNKGS